ncbi:MAG: hypothetical protein DMF64_13365 [Acidobacteria bacterium]|nr:MAG: hypothetical protein DMF64_13365 [Acidobacteriota bacterium]
MHRVERMIEIEAPLERVFDLFSDFESFPRWMRHIRAARRTGRRYTRWRADTPFGMDVEWETETTIFEPDHRIAWRSVRGDVDTDGEVVFTEIDPDTTRLRMVLGYAPPAGRVGDAFARLFGRNPAAELTEDLRRFKRIAERAAGDGRYRREAERARRRAAESERRSDARYYRDVLGMRGRDERGRAARPRAARFRADGELEREQRFDEALRAARRSQIESMRRYQAERRPAQGWQRMRERERQLDDERMLDARAEEAARADEAARPYRPRYALTPRERERKRAERDWDREAKHHLLRRNVDHLLDEGPSRDWRRWEKSSDE